MRQSSWDHQNHLFLTEICFKNSITSNKERMQKGHIFPYFVTSKCFSWYMCILGRFCHRLYKHHTFNYHGNFLTTTTTTLLPSPSKKKGGGGGELFRHQTFCCDLDSKLPPLCSSHNTVVLSHASKPVLLKIKYFLRVLHGLLPPVCMSFFKQIWKGSHPRNIFPPK